MAIQPYLFFEGRCDEALAFYRETLGAEVTTLMRFKDAPPMPEGTQCGGGNMPTPPGDKVMHAELRIGDSTIMASDGSCAGKPKFEGISLSLPVRSVEQAERTFAELSEGGQVQMPLGPTFFSPSFGMVADRFGVSWMVMVEPAEHAAAK